MVRFDPSSFSPAKEVVVFLPVASIALTTFLCLLHNLCSTLSISLCTKGGELVFHIRVISENSFMLLSCWFKPLWANRYFFCGLGSAL
jgi:hypothetical protein